MRTGEFFPDDQAELVFSDAVIEWLVDNTSAAQREQVFDDIVALFRRPWGKHPLSNRRAGDMLAGLNTAETIARTHRIVFRSTVTAEGGGLIEIIAIGPRSDNRIYDAVNALLVTGKADDLREQVWDVLAIYEDAAERVGLELWDFAPDPAPEGLIRAAVASGVLPDDEARQLSADEIRAALESGWDSVTGQPDHAKALRAATDRIAGSADPERIVRNREEPRCDVMMPRAKKPCIRRAGHPGAHRASS